MKRLFRAGHLGLIVSTAAAACLLLPMPALGDAWRLLGEAGRVPLEISSDVPAPVHQTAVQQLTFTFGGEVTGFDVSDVIVTGATMGNLVGSGAVYTLSVTGAGGRIQVSVGEDAASPGNAAASFSSFYQDTWTLTLQESPLVTMDLIRIPAGKFTMGSPLSELSHASHEKEHEVVLTEDFYLGRTEVTQSQWAAIQPFPWEQEFVGDTMPVHNVTWNDVQSWLVALDTAIGDAGTFGLPTESQWEYACRAGTTTRFSFGDGLGADEDCSAEEERTLNMWYCGNNSPEVMKAVGQKPANGWGLYDMHGSVYEFCQDWYGAYPDGPVTDPTGPEEGTNHAWRSGSYGSKARLCRSAFRTYGADHGRGNKHGFRLRAHRQ